MDTASYSGALSHLKRTKKSFNPPGKAFFFSSISHFSLWDIESNTSAQLYKSRSHTLTRSLSLTWARNSDKRFWLMRKQWRDWWEWNGRKTGDRDSFEKKMWKMEKEVRLRSQRRCYPQATTGDIMYSKRQRNITVCFFRECTKKRPIYLGSYAS